MEKRTRITPDNITTLAPDEIFVFGINSEGRHAGGAAAQAMIWGAEWGRGEGLQGQTYAIPTMFVTVNEIKPYVDRFIEFAKRNPEKRFLVTKIGCGIAGFEADQIAPLFELAVTDSIKNICLPADFFIIIISYLGIGQD